MTWPTYLRTISGKDNQKQIAEKADVAATTVGRWLAEGIVPRAEQVIAVARAYATSPLHALVAAGYLAPSELDLVPEAPRRLQMLDFSDLELAEEMVRRVAGGPSALLEAQLNEDHPAMGVLLEQDDELRDQQEALEKAAKDAGLDIRSMTPIKESDAPRRGSATERDSRARK